MNLADYLLIGQIISFIIIIISIWVQNRSAGLSSAFGGSEQIYITRRGIDNLKLYTTVVAIIVYIILRIISLYVGAPSLLEIK